MAHGLWSASFISLFFVLRMHPFFCTKSPQSGSLPIDQSISELWMSLNIYSVDAFTLCSAVMHGACSFCMLLILHIWQNLLLFNGWMHSPWTHPFTAAVCCYLEKMGFCVTLQFFTLKHRHNMSSDGRTLGVRRWDSFKNGSKASLEF